MRKALLSSRAALIASLSLFVFPLFASAQSMTYPNTRKSDQVDDYHGTKVADPYRWLEDDNSAETAAWVKAENDVTNAYFARIPYRAQVKQRLEQLFNYPKFTPPDRRGDSYVFSKNDGLQNQNVIYLQKTPDDSPDLLLDPNKFSKDGTSRLGVFAVSRDGHYCGYGISTGGSDWQEARVMEVNGRKLLDDDLKWLKVTDMAWAGNGFFYSRYPAPEGGHELSSKNENHTVYYHRVGTSQSQDELVFEDKAHPQRFHIVSTTDDEHFAILYVSDRGTGKRGNAVFYRDLTKTDKSFKPVVAEVTDDTYNVIDDVNGKLLVQTNLNAPNYRIAAFNPADSSWSEVIPEKPEVIESAKVAGGKLFVTYLKDVASHLDVYNLDGKLENEVKLPGAGSVSELQGNEKDNFIFFAFTSPNYPSTIFRYDIPSKEARVYRAPQIPGFHPDDYETKQVFYTSKDGTRVPMFLTYKKGLKLDGSNPTLLYGYGGFNISTLPVFRPFGTALLEQGFVYASANLRGGGEYGEKWHLAGTKLQKQNVFDDFIAAAEWLIANKYTSPAHLAINGGSNGGLLVGAVMNQRPELFHAAVPMVGVMDMLRFQKFTIGWNWIADYGSSDNADEFKALYAYSPLHNIRSGGKYPATLITTADHDDRVVPAHSFKYAATLQTLASKDNPVLIRIETKSGHGAVSTTKAIELTADIYSFLFYTLGVTPKY
ncbi:MAG TPA: prolyl oligopeptidase family serine peptidase [Candidatus Acidoferrum sp.]